LPKSPVCVLVAYALFRRARGAVWRGVAFALLLLALADPSLIATKFANAVIETRGEYTIGRTVVDHEKRTKRAPNCHVAFAAERDKFFALLKNTFAASR